MTLWIVNALCGGYTASNVLKWYWWRFNGYGYFWGMMAGIAASTHLPWAFPSLPALHAFPPILVISLIGMHRREPMPPSPSPTRCLMRFYMQVRPWGFWKPVLQKVQDVYPDFPPNKNFARDMFNVAVGIVWQVSIVTMPIALVTQQHTILLIAAIVTALTSLVLKFSWWNKLDEAARETLPPDFDERIAARKTQPSGMVRA